MSHCIIEPIDEVFSTSGTEWHGLARAPLDGPADLILPRTIGDETVKRLCPKIREMRVQGEIDGVTVTMPHHKALVADYREARPELATPDANGNLSEFALVPLHMPKNGYKVIGNCEVYQAAKAALQGLGAEIVTAGTLGGGKRFFLSVDIKGESEMTVCGRDKTLAFLNLITSHDGTLAAKGYDSTVRIVCQNTLDWSLQASGEVGFSVYHTSGANLAVNRMGELLNAVLTGRANFRNTMELLDSQAVTIQDADAIALAYFVLGQSAGEKELIFETSKRVRNSADEIATLFHRGAGNLGKTAYDLLQGATDYWSNGGGTGKKASKAERVSAARFGTAAEHKTAFVNMLLGNQLAELVEIGRKAKAAIVVKD